MKLMQKKREKLEQVKRLGNQKYILAKHILPDLILLRLKFKKKKIIQQFPQSRVQRDKLAFLLFS